MGGTQKQDDLKHGNKKIMDSSLQRMYMYRSFGGVLNQSVLVFAIYWYMHINKRHQYERKFAPGIGALLM